MNLAEGGPVEEKSSQHTNSSAASIPQHPQEQVPAALQSTKMSNPSVAISHLQQMHSLPSSINPNENLSSTASSKSIVHDQSTSAMNVRFKVRQSTALIENLVHNGFYSFQPYDSSNASKEQYAAQQQQSMKGSLQRRDPSSSPHPVTENGHGFP
jgi:hypothetical protein